ncbi:MAG: hypothetical protein F4091_06495 [Acidimicrobiales bacterium]|nr:hypothetical protein [Acidimicrobiales bacterium]MYD83918.1 hypothetical protein [Acidimicrobiales bacterium]MYJ65102.1 hypothetical protein [Acidimicrobiales bacterium]
MDASGWPAAGVPAAWIITMARHLGREIEKLWNKLPEPAQNLLVALSCAGVVAIAAKTIAASGGLAAPAWVKWAAGVGLAAECSRRVLALLPNGGTTTTTTTAAPKATTTTTTAPDRMTRRQWQQIKRQFRRGDRSAEEYQRYYRQWRCQKAGEHCPK